MMLKQDEQVFETSIEDLGLIEYAEAYAFQKKCLERVLASNRQSLILCEHPTVITLGRLTNPQNILWPKDKIKGCGIDILPIDRGGDITLHTLGQLVAYPILSLANYTKDLRWYMHKLEEVIIDLLGDFDIVANRFSGRTGVWVKNEKIASLGVGVRRWITFHGIALNVNTDLKMFSMIRPCGLDVHMTSIAALKGNLVDLKIVKDRMTHHFCKHFFLKG